MSYPAQSPVPHDDWFPPNPLDSMPIARDDNDPPRPEEEIAADWEDNAPCEYEPPDPEPMKEEEITMHEKMYRIATSRYNPFAIGGSENCHSDLQCNIGGSENLDKR